jgi:NADH dehydrogenase FAD-containing subunit
MNATDRPAPPRVVVVGAGMAGLATVRALSRAPVTVELVDSHNYTTFPPLLFQVATCFISPAEVARPIRALAARPGGQLPDGTGGGCGLAGSAGAAR